MNDDIKGALLLLSTIMLILIAAMLHSQINSTNHKYIAAEDCSVMYGQKAMVGRIVACRIGNPQ